MPAAEVVLVLGGVRSGKSAVAEALLARLPGPHAYLATWQPDPADGAMAARVAAHRARRPATWDVVEVGGPDLAGALRAVPGAALVDALGTWLVTAPDFAVPEGALVGALAERRQAGRSTVVVSEEVGLGVHPPTELGRRFADRLGEVNQAVAACADRVLLAVAGKVLELGEP